MMVLLIDRCYITIQIIIPVSQLLLWVLGSAGAVLPQCERGAGQSSTAQGGGSSAGPWERRGAEGAHGLPVPGIFAGFLLAEELEEHGECSAPQPSPELSLFPWTAQRCLLQRFLASKATAIYPQAGMQSVSWTKSFP